MGFEPVRFLAVPRVTASFFVVPLLSIFTSVFGLIGAGLVMLMMDFSLRTYYNQVVAAAGMTSFVGGFIKAAIFGFLVSAIGCRRGFQTKQGSQAVGIAATRAVVGGIVLIVIAEGIFAFIYYVLDI
jgi:phospholipid/cholesterol/gamma-HCH transport system permease protein